MFDRPGWTAVDRELPRHSSLLQRVHGLVLGQTLRDELLRHLTAALPHEGVGLLATDWERDGRDVRAKGGEGTLALSPLSSLPSLARAMKFYPGRNIDASPSRFTMDPVEVIVALQEIDERGWWLGAIVHSHPHGPAQPSMTDLREAHYPDALSVIVSLAEQPARVRAWRLPMGHSRSGGGAAIVEVPVWVEGDLPAREC